MMTNFEKIKSMNINELAEWLDKMNNDERDDWASVGCYHCIDYGTHHYPNDCDNCEWLGGIKEWLNKEIQENGYWQ